MAVKMRGISVSCALAALLLAAVWADHEQDHHQDHHHGSDHSHEGRICYHSPTYPNSADFAFALYKNLNANAAAGKNIFFSPLGISTALSMLSTGAAAETHRQLFSTLGYSALNQTQVNEAYEHLLYKLGHGPRDQQLDVGNAVALRSGFSPLETFLNDVRRHYSGEVFSVDLTKPAEAADEINAFIANKTQDKIKDMVKDLDAEMVMVLINYVYFNAEWKALFNPERTNKADFHVDATTKVQVDMMTKTSYYDTYWDSDNHTTVIMLHYKGSTSMMIVLPDEGKMQEVEGSINKDHIRHWRNSVSLNYVDLFLPKFSISADAPLENTLKEMGITDAFENNADFSGISEEVKVKVSKVSQKAMLSVTERGTEAVAVTIAEFILTVLPTTVRIDRPFLVFILEKSTNNIVFMGKINNPTAM